MGWLNDNEKRTGTGTGTGTPEEGNAPVPALGPPWNTFLISLRDLNPVVFVNSLFHERIYHSPVEFGRIYPRKRNLLA